MILELFVCSVLAASAAGQEVPTVNIAQGTVVGSVATDGNYFEFHGIPYADSTSGINRFKAPLPAPLFETPFVANRRDIKCVRALGVGFEGTEDCLVANIFTPTLDNARRLPVMVWIKGKEFDQANVPELSFRNFVEKEVVIVSLNYRESILGFLCLGTETAPGNAGLKDIIAGLKWVKANIAQFGGNPEDITLFGHGSGAAAVDLVTMSPMGQGLVQKAIAQSGNALAPWAVTRDNLEYALQVAEAFGHEITSTEQLSNVYTRTTVSALMSVINELELTDNALAFAPCVERHELEGVEPFLTKTPSQIIRDAEFLQIPVIIGFVDNEGTIRAKEALEDNWLQRMETSFIDFIQSDLKFETDAEKSAVAERIRDFYFGDSPIDMTTVENYLNYHGDTMMLVSTIREVRNRIFASLSPIYLYQFSYSGTLGEPFVGPISVESAAHSEELAYMFYNTPATGTSARDYTIGDILVERWTNFAKTGNPTSETSLIAWSPVTRENLNYIRVLDNAEINVSGNLEEALQNPHLIAVTFWDPIYTDHFFDAESNWEIDDTTEPPSTEGSTIDEVTTAPPPTDAITTEASPPTDAITTESSPPTDAITTESSPPTDAITTEVTPPTDAITTEPSPPTDAITTEASPPTDAITTEVTPSTDAITTEPLPPTDAITTEPSPTDEITTEASPPTDAITTESSPPTDAITTEASLPTDAITTEASPPTDAITTEPSPPTDAITTEPSPPTDAITTEASPPTDTITTESSPPTDAITTEASPPTDAITTEPSPPTEAITTEASLPTDAITTEASPPTDAITTEASPPTDAITTEPLPPTDAITTEASPPTDAITTEASPPTDAITTEASPPTDAITTEASPPTDAITTEPSPPTDAITTEPSAPTNAITTEASIPTAVITTEASTPTDAITTEASPPTDAITIEPSPPTDAITTEASLPTDAITTEASPPTDAITTEASPPTDAITTEPSPPTDAITTEPSAPTDAITTEASPPTDVITTEPSPPTDAITTEASPPTNAITTEASPPTDVITTEPSPPTDAITTEASPPTDAITTEPSPPTNAITTEASPPTDAIPTEASPPTDAITTEGITTAPPPTDDSTEDSTTDDGSTPESGESDEDPSSASNAVASTFLIISLFTLLSHFHFSQILL